MVRFLKAALLSLAFVGITAQGLALPIIHVQDFLINVNDNTKKGHASLDVGSSWGYSANGGCSVATFGSFHTTASGSWYNPYSWYEYSRSESWHNWVMTFSLAGDPGESAEIIADWEFWLASVVTAYPSGWYPNGSYAKAAGQVLLLFTGYNDDGFIYEDDYLEEEETIVWLGVDGDQARKTNSVSLGTFTVGGSSYCRVSGWLAAWSISYANPHGSLVSDLYCGLDLDLTPRAIVPPEPIPEPATILLLGSGLAGLAGFRRRFRRR